MKNLAVIAFTTNTGRVALSGIVTAIIAYIQAAIGTEALVAAIFGGVYAITQRWATRKAENGGPFANRKKSPVARMSDGP